jgi:hypothetical protein
MPRACDRAQRIARPKISVTMIAAVNPASRASAPRTIWRHVSLVDAERDTNDRVAFRATTMAATMRIWELVKMPTAPMSPAMASRM